MHKAAPAAAQTLVPAVLRTVRLLDHLAGLRRPASLTDLVKALALPKSSVHGLLVTLDALDLVHRTVDGEFALGPKALEWASAYSLQSDVIGAFNEYADEFATLSAESIMLAVLDEADVVYLACRQGTRPLAVNFKVGGRFPACCTSSGKAIMATLGDDEVRRRMANGGLRRMTRHSVSSTTALLRQLATTRELKFAVDDEETAEGMHCFGAPVHAAGREHAVAAVAVSLIKVSATPRRVAEIVPAIQSLAARLSERLGAAGAVGRIRRWS